MGLFEYHCWVFPTKILNHLMVETSEGNAKNTKYVYVNSVVKGTFSENSEVHQRTLEHLEWKFLGYFQNLKPMEIAKRANSMICTSIKVIHFCQIIRVWRNIWACHAHLCFET